MNEKAMWWLCAAGISAMPACGGSVAYGEHTVRVTEQDAGPPSSADDAGPPRSARDAAPSPTPADALAPSLRVEVNVQGAGATADVATVAFCLRVFDSASGAPVLDAAVMGGPMGGMIPLVADPTDPSCYTGQRTGYSNAWEFSVVLGGERVWNMPLTGPSFPATTCVLDWYSNPPVLTVDWAPSSEPGVASTVSVFQESPAPALYQTPPSWNLPGHDEGTAGPFSLGTSAVPSNSYRINVSLTTGWRSFDWGAAMIGIASDTSSVTCD